MNNVPAEIPAERPERSLGQLHETVERVIAFYRSLGSGGAHSDPGGSPEADFSVSSAWTARDALVHVVFWHESFARNVGDLAGARAPRPLKGTYARLSERASEENRDSTVEELLGRLASAQRTIEQSVFNPAVGLIPYKVGSRPYSATEHLSVVSEHVSGHLKKVEAAWDALGPEGATVERRLITRERGIPMLVPANYDDLWSKDREAQNAAYTALLVATAEPVDWAYSVWDDVVAHLASPDNHDRAIAAQVLARLAKSDPEDRLRTDFSALFAVTRDERFVTARHSLLALWEVGASGPWQREMLLEALKTRFSECSTEKNCTLVRYDVMVVLKQLYDATGDSAARDVGVALLETEPDEKYRKKYAGVWRGAPQQIDEHTEIS